MGKRRNPSPSSAADILRRRLSSSFPNSSPSLEIAVSHLRSHYPDYSRLKLIPFTNFVRKTLTQLPQTSNSNQNSDYDNDDDIARSRRKLRKSDDVSEKSLLRACPAAKQNSASARASSSSDDDDSTSTNVDPEFDFTKSMLRDGYVKKTKTKSNEVGVDLVMEIDRTPSRRLETALVAGVVSEKGEISEKESLRFKNLGGISGVIEELRMRVILPFFHLDVLKLMGIRPPAGILLHGPPGCGKTTLARAIANEAGVPFYEISAPEIVTGVAGASEENIRDIFKKAHRTAPSVIFIDEIDAIASKRDNLQREMERRIVTQLMTCMEQSYRTPKSDDANSESESSEKKPGYVLVIGATNRPDAIDQALRRPGRFDREIALGAPDENARAEILSVLIRNLRVDSQFDLKKIARSTHGYVGADLVALAREAGMLAIDGIFEKRKSQILDVSEEKNNDDWLKKPLTTEEYENLSLNMSNFEKATKMVQPSSIRVGFSPIPDVTWKDVGGLLSVRKELNRCIVQRIKYPESYEEFGISLETGFMLYGPPGCGKTLIAKAVANESGAHFMYIKGPELLSKYVGESELAARNIFSRARTSSPCIIFFDEVDALTTKRGKEGGWVVERFVAQLLAELSGSDQQRKGVYIIGATNRLDVVDPALLRPGRFEKVIYVPLPDYHERLHILQTIAVKMPVSTDVDLGAIAKRCENFSGADLAALMKEAALAARDEKQNSIGQEFEIVVPAIKMPHFEHALNKATPSVSDQDRRTYNKTAIQLRAS